MNTNRKSIFPEIRTSNLFLRRFVSDDLENVFRGLSNKDVIRYYGVSYETMESTKEQMTWFEDLEETGKGIWWAVCSPENKIFYGAGGLNSVNNEHKKAEAGFWLLPEFWGQGIIQEAMPLICKYGFENLGLHRIEGFVETDNKKSKRALEKLGFKLEGTMVDCEIKNGKFISLDIYAFLKMQN